MEPVIVEQKFDHPIQVVWDAITKLEEMKIWFFENISSFSPQVGFETSFDVHSNNLIFPHKWKLLEVIPLEKIVYNWSYSGYKGNSLVTFQLEQIKDQTKLLLTHQVIESFPQNISELTRESCVEGWHYFINQRLKVYLDKKKINRL